MRLRDKVVAVMAKYPTPGRVKTRLGAELGAERACSLYHAFLEDTATNIGDGDWDVVWAVHPPRAPLRMIVGETAICMDQYGADLGERMWQCFQTLFMYGGRRVVIIGADVPHLAATTVAAAFVVLDTADACLVPTRDGGYGLVGLSAPHDLFHGITMGTAHVCADTRARATELGLTLHLFDESFDVDEASDVARLEAFLAADPTALPRTSAILAQWREEGVDLCARRAT